MVGSRALRRALSNGWTSANPSNTASLATPIVEAPLLGTTTAAFTRTLAPLPDQSAIVNLTVSGVTILPPDYDASVAPPQINTVVNAADLTTNIAPGGLITLFGTQLSPGQFGQRRNAAAHRACQQLSDRQRAPDADSVRVPHSGERADAV